MATEEEIDDSLYSRQRYVLGDTAMKAMAHSSVFLSGLGGLGVEIAKNVALAGVRSLVLHDIKTAAFKDLGTQFFLREEDVTAKRNRAEACQARLAELNPHVSISSSSASLTMESDLSILCQYQCVVLTEAPQSLLIKVDEFCRQQQPPIKFIAGDVIGLYSYAFCDFGPEFTIMDPTGEESKESFIATITKENPGVVTSADNRMHGFESGDYVMFKEIEGMTILNGVTQQVKVLSPYAYSICDTSGDEYRPYKNGGIAVQVKVPKTVTFESLAKQLVSPSTSFVDFLKDPVFSHVAICSLQQFREDHGRLPGVRSIEDSNILIEIAKQLNDKLDNPLNPLDEESLRRISLTAEGCFAPLTATMGGIIAQEVLKALTGKFTPINQWLHLDAREVLRDISQSPASTFQPRNDRYDALRICIGEDLLQKFHSLKLFMVGCGAIGCEMLKNYALLGIATADKSKITITDNDIIEKSNLNRQFLFRPHHIQKPKSTTAAASTQDINPDVKIHAHQHKVCPETEMTVFNDEFFKAMDVVVNALDNVAARQYMDSRCVTNERPLMESGTMGAKGHVQVIVPHMTETYGSQRDPPDESVPYCTLKSFPSTVEHTIQWARDKFESSFTQKPTMFNKYWTTNGSAEEVVKKLQNSEQPENSEAVIKLLKNRPSSWAECISIARIKFEKYFNHKAKQLLSAFPLDHKMSDGTPFWQSPKRPPAPVVFDTSSELHMLFVVSTARLTAAFCDIPVSQHDLSTDTLLRILSGVKVPQFQLSNKVIETEVTSPTKPEHSEPSVTADEIEHCQQQLAQLIAKKKATTTHCRMIPAEFEKDDDTNGHIDFITSASNLRSTMYHIEPADRFKTKRIAGRIVPAIATTTAAVAGLATLELIKYIQGATLSDYRNCFLNLGLSLIMFSEPGPANVTTIKPGLKFTQWDMWHVHGHKGYTLQDFTQHFKEKYDMSVSLVVHGVKMIFVPMIPGHMKRLGKRMLELLKPSDGVKYMDLTIGFEPPSEDADEDLPAPPVRYHFAK
ncbi:ubiquitin-like modifier-activating enzyme 6 [Acanthaster planci]|uniref:E1 ubiquitin-activating enzyme n=1 Tax=Acanthaster planci TaxID=133434 RepID=A0A8B7ZDK4_ACAPL|nr:ubiquitin-like modifier-activating enzyme 6 [Acanthaster planci]XP_022102925.1 ubiquitin-like modifier-activating enzyme 6 [Acanthaster planci]XP_022102926.1 ubiquitin-like modifier-activating enzyme 6 [Acanthaster planci]